MASSSNLSPSSVLASVATASSVNAASSSIAVGSSTFSAQIQSSTLLLSSADSAGVSSRPSGLSLSDTFSPSLSSVVASSGGLAASSVLPSSAVSSASTSAAARSRPAPLPLPGPSTAAEPSFTAVPSVLSTFSVAPSSVVVNPSTSVKTSPSISRALPDKVVSSAGNKLPSTAPSILSQPVAGLVSSVAEVSPSVKMAEQAASAAASSVAVSSIDQSSQISASAPGSSAASQGSSVAPTETTIRGDPSPPSQSPESSSATPAASDPVSSPSRPSVTSLAPTQPPASSSAAPALTSDSVVSVSSASPAAPGSSASRDGGISPGSTSIRAVSSPSSPAPASHDHTQSVPKIPLPITKLAPVIHSTAATSPAPRIFASSAAGTEAAAVHSSESGPVLTPLIQQNDVSVHASQDSASPTSVAANGPVSSPEVHASPSAAPHAPASPTSTLSMDDSEKASGMVQANAQTQSPTATSTITDQPETTLSTPVFMTVTNSDHHTSLSVPPIFTSTVVSELPDGGLVTYTHVIANPTGIYGVEIDNPMGFFANSGAVAGVFLAVGIVVTAIGVGICLFIRRRRRRRNPRFIDTISRPLPMPENPFEDPRDFTPPNMRYALGHPEGSTLVIGSASRQSGDTRRSSSGRSSRTRGGAERYSGLGLAGVGAHGRSASMGSARVSSEMRAHHHLSGQSGVVGLAITSDQRVDSARPRRVEPSSARSSPSIYPPTLPSLRNEETDGALVDVPLERPSNLSRTGSSPSVHSVTRKPVPSPEPEQEPAKEAIAAPIPRAPEQITTARPPVVPPRSPLRRNSYHNSTTSAMAVPPQPLSPAPSYTRTQISLDTPASTPTPTHTLPPPIPPRAPRDRDTFGAEMAAIVLKTFEPLTPPASLSSLSPPTSSQGHERESDTAPLSPSSERSNPFAEVQEQRAARAGPPGLAGYGLPVSPRKNTFYSRRSTSQRRPSVEWRK
ncbi:hypothetical protein BV20DRAFT_1048247 [Pilatotrama ljubarskyi]|nr:hypothetical protein BV20DRAFT_1048247 [Pilatotrama ljubarskyi]